MFGMLTQAMAVETFDVTARKAHQWTMVALVVAGFLLGNLIGPVLVAVAGLIMLVGRLTWRVLEPRGLLKRRDRVEDHQTRRIARVMGGVLWLVAAALVVVGLPVAGWALAGLISAMVVLDAALDFCALCFAFLHLERRGLLPAALRHT